MQATALAVLSPSVGRTHGPPTVAPARVTLARFTAPRPADGLASTVVATMPAVVALPVVPVLPACP